MLFDTRRIRASQRIVMEVARSKRHAEPSADFFSALANLQGRSGPVLSTRERLAICFDLEDVRADVLLQVVRRSGELAQQNPIREIPPDEQPRITAAFDAGVAAIARERPDIGEAFGLMTSLVLALDIPGLSSGSDERAIGALWIGPTRRWTADTCAVALAHETVHQLLFLEEMVHRLFAPDRSELSRSDALVLSPLRAQRRPYDVAFHAACVATTLSDLALNSGIGRYDEAAHHRLLHTLDELDRKRDFLTARGRALLDGTRAQARGLATDQVK